MAEAFERFANVQRPEHPLRWDPLHTPGRSSSNSGGSRAGNGQPAQKRQRRPADRPQRPTQTADSQAALRRAIDGAFEFIEARPRPSPPTSPSRPSSPAGTESATDGDSEGPGASGTRRQALGEHARDLSDEQFARLVRVHQSSPYGAVLAGGMTKLSASLASQIRIQQQRTKMVSVLERVQRGRTLRAGDVARARWARALDMMHMTDKVLSPTQVTLVTSMLACAAHLICGPEFAAIRPEFQKSLGRVTMPRGVRVLAARRTGKTVSVAITCAILLVLGIRIPMVVIASSQRISDALKELTFELASQMDPNLGDRLARANVRSGAVVVEEYMGSPDDALRTGNVNKMVALPNSAAATKGHGGKVIVADEAALLDENTMAEGIAPMLAVEGTVLYMVSTNRGGGVKDSYTRLFLEDARRKQRIERRQREAAHIQQEAERRRMMALLSATALDGQGRADWNTPPPQAQAGRSHDSILEERMRKDADSRELDAAIQDLEREKEGSLLSFDIKLICKACADEFLERGELGSRCVHVTETPAWLANNGELTRELIPNDDIYAQEALNLVVDKVKGVFKTRHIEWLVEEFLAPLRKIAEARKRCQSLQRSMQLVCSDQPPDEEPLSLQSARAMLAKAEAAARQTGVNLHELGPIGETYTFVDPAGGGSQSDYAIVTVVFAEVARSEAVRAMIKGQEAKHREEQPGLPLPRAAEPKFKTCVVVGLASIDAKEQENIEQVLKTYCRRLNKKAPRATHFVGIENNYGGETMANMIFKRMAPHLENCQEWRDPDDRLQRDFVAGQPVSEFRIQRKHGLTTDRQIKQLGVALLGQNMASGRLRLANGLISLGRPNSVVMVEELRDQLTRFREVSPGKFAGKTGPTEKDDLVISLLLLYAWKWKHESAQEPAEVAY